MPATVSSTHTVIRFFKKFETLLASKISVASQFVNTDFVGVRDAASILVAVVVEIQTAIRLAFAKQIGVAILVAGGD